MDKDFFFLVDIGIVYIYGLVMPPGLSVFCPGTSSVCDAATCDSHIPGTRGMHYYPWLVCWCGDSLTFCLKRWSSQAPLLEFLRL
jgi:hypothetical protein